MPGKQKRVENEVLVSLVANEIEPAMSSCHHVWIKSMETCI